MIIDDPSFVGDVAIVGAGAAGLATAIFTARRCPGGNIVALDGAKKIGAKILVSGGGRCNVTNVKVAPDDFFLLTPRNLPSGSCCVEVCIVVSLLIVINDWVVNLRTTHLG